MVSPARTVPGPDRLAEAAVADAVKGTSSNIVSSRADRLEAIFFIFVFLRQHARG